VQRLRLIRPTGRIVLEIPPDATTLPDLALEDNDRLYIPSRATTVGVFGSVFNGGSYLYARGRSVDDYLQLAGGPTRGADQKSVFVIRANGTVVSRLQSDVGWTSRGEQFARLQTEPGDVIFVPEEMDKTTFVQVAKDWTQIFFQFGFGLASIVDVLRN
jgi:protein involved in polysaccharide export with SLBB domain